jgi:hypothetical protein
LRNLEQVPVIGPVTHPGDGGRTVAELMVGPGGWNGIRLDVRRDVDYASRRRPATVSASTAGSLSPKYARALAQALLAMADEAERIDAESRSHNEGL